MRLVNHRSILWDDAARVVEYYHIELADHDVVFAEGGSASRCGRSPCTSPG
jgi:Hint domain